MAAPPIPNTHSQILVLPDGRSLGYATYGRPPSASTPNIFYFHGHPSSRLEGAVWFNNLVNPRSQDINAHVVSIDRPGLGLSTFQPSRRILDWPSDVLALADHLSINTFHILAVSGGSPYALACAKNIPRSRLLNTAVVSGIYPLNLGTQGMLMQLRVLLFVASWLPSLAGTLLDWEIGTSARDADPKVLEDKFMKAMAGRPDKDVRCLDNEELRGQITESMRAAFVQGKQGAGMELKLLIDWGFGLEDVNGENLTLWHGGADVNTPFGMAEKAAGLLKGCEFMTFEEETHMSLPYNRAEDILKRLLQLEG